MEIRGLCHLSADRSDFFISEETRSVVKVPTKVD